MCVCKYEIFFRLSIVQSESRPLLLFSPSTNETQLTGKEEMYCTVVVLCVFFPLKYAFERLGGCHVVWWSD